MNKLVFRLSTKHIQNWTFANFLQKMADVRCKHACNLLHRGTTNYFTFMPHMSILKNILKPFVEFSEGDKTVSSQEIKLQKARKESSAGPTDKAGAMDTSYSPDPVASVKSGEYQKHFENLIEEANARNPLFQGTDFKEFIDSKIDVEAITDEEAKYRTAFNVLKRTGLTKERLISTGQEYINVIDRDLKGFNDAFAQQYKTDVEQKEKLLKSKSEELEALNEKITVLNNELKQLSQQVIESRNTLTNKKNSFMLAGESKKTEIKEELQKINQYFS